MKKLILSILLMLILLPQVFAQDKEPITEIQAIDIAKRYVICNGLYAPSEVEGVKSAFFSENPDSWLVRFPPKKAPDGAEYDDSAVRIFVSSDGEKVRMFF